MTVPGAFPQSRVLALLQDRSSSGVRATLTAARLTHHLLLLRGVLDATAAQAPEAARAAGLRDSFATLAGLDVQDRAAVEHVLSHPWVGAWAVTCLRHLENPDDVPLAVHLAYLGSITAAVALESRRASAVTVPVRDGLVPVTGRGALRRPGGPATCTLGLLETAPDGTVRVDGDSSSWIPVRTLTSDGEPFLELDVDDVDPYRDVDALGADGRLAAADAVRWIDTVRRAWRLLVDQHDFLAGGVAATLRVLVPLAAAGTPGRSSVSSRHALGSVYLTSPADPAQLAATLVHEAAHTELNEILGLASVLRPDDRRVYSPWRADPRPLLGVLHGAFAGLQVARFWEEESSWRGPGGSLAALEGARARRQTRAGIVILRGSGALTPDGSCLVDTLDVALREIEERPAAPLVERLADLLAEDHAVSWRLRNLVTDPDVLARLVAAWSSGRSAPSLRDLGTPVLSRRAAVFAEDPRLRLATAMLDPGGEQCRGEPASDADRLLLDGDVAGALGRYEREAADGASGASTWAGLLLAAARVRRRPHTVTVARPELIRDLYAELRRAANGGSSPTPTEVVDWLDNSATEGSDQASERSVSSSGWPRVRCVSSSAAPMN